MIAHERSDRVTRRVGLEDVGLVHDEDGLLPPVANPFEEEAFALGERAVGRRHEEHEVGSRDELLRQLLVLAQHGIGARGVDDLQIAQQFERRHDLGEPVVEHSQPDRFLAVAHEGDARGGGRHAFFEHIATEQRIDQGALAGIEFADDHEEEQRVEPGHALCERRLIAFERPGVFQHGLEIGEQRTFIVEEGLGLVGEEARMGVSHVLSLCTRMPDRQRCGIGTRLRGDGPGDVLPRRAAGLISSRP